MAPVREELGLLLVVLIAVGLLAFGVVELIWPRARRRLPSAHREALVPVAPAPWRTAPTTPAVAVPREEPPVAITDVEALIGQAEYLAEFPLRALVVVRRA